jgi:putative ABC transport system permease protein
MSWWQRLWKKRELEERLRRELRFHFRQSLCESLLLACTGATLGLALARILSKTILAFLTVEGDPVHLDLSLDWRMLAFTASVALAACVVFGLAPAWASAPLS